MVQSSIATCLSLLCRCNTIRDLEHLLAQLIVVGISKDYLGMRKLVAHCSNPTSGNLEYAMLLLKQIQEPNPFAWNIVIRGYEQSCNSSQAVHLYHEMLQKKVLPDKFTFPFVLKACSRLCALSEGEQIHCQILKRPHQNDMFVQGSLIFMYAKCGIIEAAYALFNLMPHKNSICWNTMIDGFIKQGNFESARQLFDQMPQKDLISWNTMIDGHTKCGQVEAARQLFDEMPIRDIFSWNCMIYGYAKNGNMNSARELFDCMSVRDVITWTILLNGYAKCGKIDMAHQLFEKTPYKSLVTWNTMIDGYAKFGEIGSALKMFDAMPYKNLTSWNVMLDAYVKQGEMDIAHKIFNRMQFRDIFSWNIMIDGYARTNNTRVAQELFDTMPYRDIVSWNAMIACYKQNGHSKEAIKLFCDMQRSGEKPDCSTLAVVLSAIAELGLFIHGKWVHAYLDRNKFPLDCVAGAALIDMYSKCGYVDVALRIFDSIIQKNVDHWNSMISGLAIHGCGSHAVYLFEEMLQSAVRPDDITLIGVISACSHAGLVLEGRLYFKVMSIEYGIVPKIQHYGCMIDLLSRAGHLEEAWELVQNMPMRPNAVIWRALLGACRNHDNIEIGEHAAECLVDLEPHDTSSYVLLSNIYGATGQWERVTEIRRRMKLKGMVKDPGCSSIELNGEVHEFIVGDSAHPEIAEIQLLLHQMTHGFVSAGYALDMKCSRLDANQ